MRRVLGALTDADLIAATREGDESAYAELWKRHSRVAMTAARSYARVGDPEDFVAEAFTTIYRALQSGSGPTGQFRPYLYTVIRNLGVRAVRQASHRANDVDLDALSDPTCVEDTITDWQEATVLAAAWRALPERWRTVLRYSEVDQLTPREIAPLLGMSANAVSALAYRARSALRASWLQQHIAGRDSDDECATITRDLGAYVAGTLGARAATTVREHLEVCGPCERISAETTRIATRRLLAIPPFIAVPTADGALRGFASSVALRASGAAASGHFSAALVAAAVVGAMVIGGGLTWTLGATSTHSERPPVAAPRAAQEVVDESASGSVVVPPPPAATPPPAPPEDEIAAPAESVAASIRARLPLADVPPLPAYTNSGTLALTGTAVPGAVITVAGNGFTARTLAAADGTWAWASAPLQDGDTALSIVQSLDGFEPSAPVVLSTVIDTVAPVTPTLATTWTAQQASRPVFSGSGEPGALVTVMGGDGDWAEYTTVDAAGLWQLATPQLRADAPPVSVSQSDRAGNSSPTVTSGAFGWHPTIIRTNGSNLPQGPVALEVQGWSGADFVAEFQGQTILGQLDYVGSAIIDLDLLPGVYVIDVVYSDPMGVYAVDAARHTVWFTVY